MVEFSNEQYLLLDFFQNASTFIKLNVKSSGHWLLTRSNRLFCGHNFMRIEEMDGSEPNGRKI